ncbi:hypothetical protein JCM1393_23600 [Clostridium carnis]
MEKSAKIITFIGDVLVSIACIVLSVTSIVDSAIWILVSIPVIVLVWVGRRYAIGKQSKKWSIAMLILTGIWGYYLTWFGMIELLGYLIYIIYLNAEEQSNNIYI